MPLTNLRKLWGSSKQKTTSEAESDYERTIERGADSKPAGPQLPLLQVWPSQDSPEKMSSTGQHFIFHCEDISNIQQNDSGIDSVQVYKNPILLVHFCGKFSKNFCFADTDECIKIDLFIGSAIFRQPTIGKREDPIKY